MDLIFKALNDPTRRNLLDALRNEDGQTLSELEERLSMTRFGVMKHLKLLEEAHLITTKKSGRFKYHYLNAVPLQQVIDRWIEPLLRKPTARAVLNLKSELEKDMSEKPDFIHETFIATTHDRLWDALMDPEVAAACHMACDKAEAVEGGGMTFILPNGHTMLTQRYTKIDPKTRIESTFEPNFGEGMTESSRCVYIITPEANACKLRIEHYGVPKGQESVAEGWARWAASAKSYLETGKAIKGFGA